MSLADFTGFEELIGRRWHRLVGGTPSYPSHPEAAVRFEEMRNVLGVFYRAIGGEHGIQLSTTGVTRSGHRLRLRQRLGMADERLAHPTLDNEFLLLPDVIDCLSERRLNRDLYLWLAAYFTFIDRSMMGTFTDPLRTDIYFLRRAATATRSALDVFPGLRPIHRRLCTAVTAARPARRLPSTEASVEDSISALLGGAPPKGRQAAVWSYVSGDDHDPKAFTAPRGYRPFLPVPLWGGLAERAPVRRVDHAESDQGTGKDTEDQRRHRASHRVADQTEHNDPLILNRFEKILSIGELVNLNRVINDDNEEDAERAIDDLDIMDIAGHHRRASNRLKLDIGLPPAAVDKSALSEAITYPEWDFRRNSYIHDHCAVITGPAPTEGENWEPDVEARSRIRRVRHQFEAFLPKRLAINRQADGSELDLDAVVRSRCDLVASGYGSDSVYIDIRDRTRDLAVAFLVDVSLSTDSWVENRRVIDVEKEALIAMAHGLTACGDDHAIFTFTSRRRNFVRVQTVKDFDENMSHTVFRRISSLKPGYFTRIGAALRHVTAQLDDRTNRHRLLLLLSDGKPNDLDHYEGRYGIEDTRRAIREARRKGIAVFGITVDHRARDYFPYLFGRGSFHIVRRLAELSAALPKLYRQLVT